VLRGGCIHILNLLKLNPKGIYKTVANGIEISRNISTGGKINHL
jgi:hypothetical protein